MPPQPQSSKVARSTPKSGNSSKAIISSPKASNPSKVAKSSPISKSKSKIASKIKFKKEVFFEDITGTKRIQTPEERNLGKILANIYVEIDQFARDQVIHDHDQNHSSKAFEDKRDVIRLFLRRAKTLAMYRDNKADATQRLQQFNTTNANVERVIKAALSDLNTERELARRYAQFLQKPNLMILSVCAHSRTFRETFQRILQRKDEKAKGKPKWADLCRMIVKNAASLELFALVRSLRWREALDNYDDNFRMLVAVVGPTTPALAGNPSLGYLTKEIKQVHDIGDEKRQAQWALEGPKDPAFRPTVKIMMTEHLNSRIAQSELKPVVDTELTVYQVDIDDSRVLYDIPGWHPRLKLGSGGRDPRFCGTVQPKRSEKSGDAEAIGPCESCGAYSTKDEVINAKQCECDFAEFLRKHKMPNMLMELVETEKMGTGVRSLRNMKAGVFLGEYIGEIVSEGLQIYGDSRYLMDLDATYQRHHYNMAIEATQFGNWTRYINHSCRPNCEYVSRNIGQISRICIATIREIAFGEQLTVDYGLVYWKNLKAYGCACGYSDCKNWPETVDDKGKELDEKQTLREAKLAGKAPTWAASDDNIPWDDPVKRDS